MYFASITLLIGQVIPYVIFPFFQFLIGSSEIGSFPNSLIIFSVSPMILPAALCVMITYSMSVFPTVFSSITASVAPSFNPKLDISILFIFFLQASSCINKRDSEHDSSRSCPQTRFRWSNHMCTNRPFLLQHFSYVCPWSLEYVHQVESLFHLALQFFIHFVSAIPEEGYWVGWLR